MSRKIIGITVGTQLPKPNFKQTDPAKGDYIKNKPDFDGLKADLEDLKTMVGDTSVSEQVADIVDTTLAVSGKAADAQVVGDMLNAKMEAYIIPIEQVDDEYQILSSFGFAWADLVDAIENDCFVACRDVSDESGTIFNLTSFWESDGYAIFTTSDSTQVIDLELSAGGAIATYIQHIGTQTSFDVSGAPADSKAVGDALAQKSQVQIITWEADD
jgi:hypothetical protein